MINELVWVFVALNILHAKSINVILLSSVAYLNVTYNFFTLSYIDQEFVKRVIEYKIFIDFLYYVLLKYLSF